MSVAFLSPEQACELLPGMTTVRLRDLRSKGRGPAYYKPTSKTVLYKESDVLAWVESTRVETGG